MILNSDVLADLHTHTIFSKHAYSTVVENMKVAVDRGLKFIAITDHYFGNGDELERKNEINRIRYMGERVNSPSINSNIYVVGSAEFNLCQPVFTFEKLSELKWKPIGLHNWFVKTSEISLLDLFNSFKYAYEKLGHNAFVHIERELHKVNHGLYGAELNQDIKSFFDDMVSFAKENNIYLEVNESSLVTNECGGAERLKYWVKKAKENGNKIYLGTDAHFCEEVGSFENALRVLNDIDYPKELILNCNYSEMKNLFIGD